MAFRLISAAMAGVFAIAVAVQYNDPDPARWMLVYGAALGLSAWVVVRKDAPLLPAVLLSLVALAMGLVVGVGVSDSVALPEMFRSWEMESPAVEEAREAVGLLIVAGWTALLALRAAWARRRRG